MDTAEPFHKINSIGMFEHVGEEKLPAFFAKAYRCWRLIWAGYYHLLSKGSLGEYQFLFRKPEALG